MLDAALWVITNIGMAFYNLFYAIFNPGTWLDWSDPIAKVKFIYYGGSVEFFFVIFTTFLVITAVGIWKREFLWGVVRGGEFIANSVGRVAAWAGLLMVLQQILIIFLQRIFRVSEITVGPFGTVFTRDLSWFSEELKLYNTLIVCLCVAYTFVQGGHVRVDLVYSVVKHRTKRVIDMVGCLVFMMPAMVLTWMYAWYFMWRHLVTPKISASDTLELLERKARILKWNVETIAFSPNGFDAYFLFKILIVVFCGMVFLQACTFFWRSYLEFVEGETSVGKYHDKDRLGDEDAELAAEIH